MKRVVTEFADHEKAGTYSYSTAPVAWALGREDGPQFPVLSHRVVRDSTFAIALGVDGTSISVIADEDNRDPLDDMDRAIAALQWARDSMGDLLREQG